jgi:1,4-alpha-glucan branching enzyme
MSAPGSRADDPALGGEDVGTVCVVLHTHLPWVRGHGTWPVGEEWLHQVWAHSYGPLLRMLHDLAADGRRDLLTLSVTPVLAAQLDDPHLLTEQHHWLGAWLLRAEALLREPDGDLRALGRSEVARATSALAEFEARWRHGGSPVLRPLADAGVVELLGGPATHPVLPLTHPRIADAALQVGVEDQVLRLGRRPAGIWSPECGWTPGLERLLARHQVQHLMLDGPTLQHAGVSTALGHPLLDSDVVAFGRDLAVTYRVWSPTQGYPGGPWYRDFHTYHEPSGIKRARVTGQDVPGAAKAPYDPVAALAAVSADVADFVDTVIGRLRLLRERERRPGLVVVGYDTELFGHWWAEGVPWLRQVLLALPRAGVRVTTLGGAVRAGLVGRAVRPLPGSWGLGKDFHIWDGPAVADLRSRQTAVEDDLLRLVDATVDATPRDPVGDRRLDAAFRQGLLTIASDWAFMVSHGSAAGYARDRVIEHERRFRTVADAIGAGTDVESADLGADPLFAHLDARLLRRRPGGPQ